MLSKKLERKQTESVGLYLFCNFSFFWFKNELSKYLMSVTKPIKLFIEVSKEASLHADSWVSLCFYVERVHYSACVFFFYLELNADKVTNSKHMPCLWRWSFGRLKLIDFTVLPFWDRCNRLGNLSAAPVSKRICLWSPECGTSYRNVASIVYRGCSNTWAYCKVIKGSVIRMCVSLLSFNQLPTPFVTYINTD